MTQPKYTNADCPLYGSEYCAALNMESCEKCTVDCTDEEKTARVKQDLADMAALLPEDGMLCLRRRLSASALPLTEEERERVLYKNDAALYGIAL